MQSFNHDGFELAFLDRQPDSGAGDPVLLIHGFASSHFVNWVSPGWFKTLNDAGYRVIRVTSADLFGDPEAFLVRLCTLLDSRRA